LSNSDEGARLTSSDTNLTIEEQTQQVLDELWSEQLIPFALNVGKITKDSAEYTIHFYDSRIRTALVPVTDAQPFKDRVRSAVLARVGQMSGPLNSTRTDQD
jgi:hypothetical protein